MAEFPDILLLSSNFPPVIGGSSVVYDQICRNARRQIVALGTERNYETGEAWDGYQIAAREPDYILHRLGLLRPPTKPRQPSSRIETITRLLTVDARVMLSALYHIADLVLRCRLKIVCIGELISCGWLVFPLRYLLRRRVILFTHGEEISQQDDSFLATRRGLFLRHANAIIAVSLFCKGEIVARYGIHPAKIHVVSNGVDLATFCRGHVNQSCLPEHIRTQRIILSVSRLVERKGQKYLIHALPQILAAVPDAHCVIAGSGPLAGYLQGLAERLGIHQHCTFVGAVPDDLLVELYRTAEVFVLPCHTLSNGDTEGFGLVFLEANACGTPVIGGAAGGTVEAVVDGETGKLVNGANPTEIAEAVITLLANPGLARRLAENGWQRAQVCDWHVTAQKFLAVCKDSQHRDCNYAYHGHVPALKAGHAQPGFTTQPPGLLVTVDVEEEFPWTSFSRDGHVVRGLEALEAFHKACVALGISPVYLLSYPVLSNKAFCAFFRNVQEAASGELGIHLHSWTTPPFWETPNVYTSYQCNLPMHVERRKLEALCARFTECFGYRPTIHRAGRWGGSARTSDLLADMGITVDLSPSAGQGAREMGAPDFSNLDGTPFWSGRRTNVLTIPASVGTYLRGPRCMSNALRRGLGISILKRFGRPVRFSPEGANGDILTEMAREFRHSGQPVAVYTLHSTSLYEGGNPYSASKEKAVQLWSRSQQFLSDVVASGSLIPTTCAELRQRALAEARALR